MRVSSIIAWQRARTSELLFSLLCAILSIYKFMSLDLLPRTEENSLLKISLLILYDSTDNKNLPPSPKYLRLLIYILLSNHLSLSVSWAWRFTPNKYIMAQYVTFKIVTINNVVSVLGSLSFSQSAAVCELPLEQPTWQRTEGSLSSRALEELKPTKNWILPSTMRVSL